MLGAQIRENIALGDPTRMGDDAAIERAVHLGGGFELIAHLPDVKDITAFSNTLPQSILQGPAVQMRPSHQVALTLKLTDSNNTGRTQRPGLNHRTASLAPCSFHPLIVPSLFLYSI